MLDTGCWVMRFRLETTDAASTKTDIAVTPVLPSIQHPASLSAKNSTPALQHSSIPTAAANNTGTAQHPVSLSAKNSTPTFQPQQPTTPALPSIQYPVSSITLSKEQHSNTPTVIRHSPQGHSSSSSPASHTRFRPPSSCTSAARTRRLFGRRLKGAGRL